MSVLCSFNNRLKELRVKNDLSQEELAIKLGMNGKSGRSTINNWETGGYNIKADKLARIAQTFGVTADWLLGLSEVETPDGSIQGACKVTGLSEEAVYKVKQSLTAETLSLLLESDSFQVLLTDIARLRFQKSLMEETNTELAEYERNGYPEDFDNIGFPIWYEENLLKLRLYSFEIEKAFSSMLEQLLPTFDLISECKNIYEEDKNKWRALS